MRAEPGQMLSHYRLVEKIGEGGMGVVWKAVDTRLDREVAIKVLPEQFAQDEERMARFEREAKVLASLNHPGIAGIHGLEEVDGHRLLVMEMVPGTNLGERLKAGPLPVEEALEAARQMSDALEAAHEIGVVHRDLKPANIQMTPDGQVKILDFGLAKALETASPLESGSMSPTITMPTREGVILGTAAYMSPEQAKGKSVDRRADIWAFGCVLYEMLAGRRPFGGEGTSEVLAAVIMSPPDMEALPGGLPTMVRNLVGRCLEKEPRRRLRDIGDARIQIEEVLSGEAAESEGTREPEPGVRAGRSGRYLGFATALLIVAATSASVGWWLKETPPAAAVRRFGIRPLEMSRPTRFGNVLAVSPTGESVAWAGETGIWVRDLDRMEPRKIATVDHPDMLTWSPDGEWIAYAASESFWKVPAIGGPVTQFAKHGGPLSAGSGATWGPNGRLIFAKGTDSLYEISARGGVPKPILDPNEGETDLHQPSFLPEGRGILYVSHRDPGDPDTIVVWTGDRRKEILRLEEQYIASPHYASSGHIIFRREPDGTGIWALPFSLDELEATGEPFLVTSRAAQPSVASDGTLVYLRSPATDACRMVWVDRRGETVGMLGEPERFWPMPAISPDGRRVAVTIRGVEYEDLWIYDRERGTKTRLTMAERDEFGPSWSHRGDRIVYTAGPVPSEFSVWMIASDGSSPPEKIADGLGGIFTPGDKALLLGMFGKERLPTLARMSLDGERHVEPVSIGLMNTVHPRISPDGRYIAFSSIESGRHEIYIRRYPDLTGRWQVSTQGGMFPRWNGDGDEIYYVQENDIMAVEVRTGDEPILGTPERLFTREPLGACPLPNSWPPAFDVTPDGKLFLIFEPVEEDATPLRIEVVQNWFEDFREE